MGIYEQLWKEIELVNDTIKFEKKMREIGFRHFDERLKEIEGKPLKATIKTCPCCGWPIDA